MGRERLTAEDLATRRQIVERILEANRAGQNGDPADWAALNAWEKQFGSEDPGPLDNGDFVSPTAPPEIAGALLDAAEAGDTQAVKDLQILARGLAAWDTSPQ